jgi:transposase
MCARVGRPSIAPEKLLREQLPQVLHSIGGERSLMEEMDYNFLFLWFVPQDVVGAASGLMENRVKFHAFPRNALRTGG